MAMVKCNGGKQVHAAFGLWAGGRSGGLGLLWFIFVSWLFCFVVCLFVCFSFSFDSFFSVSFLWLFCWKMNVCYCLSVSRFWGGNDVRMFGGF